MNINHENNKFNLGDPEDFPFYTNLSDEDIKDKILGPHQTLACWSDLLGFGKQLDENNWKLGTDDTNLLIRRLQNLVSGIKARTFHNVEESLFINDGVIRTLQPNIYKNGYINDLISWINSCLVVHSNATGKEKDYNLPGIRSVISKGEVILYSGISRENEGVLQPMFSQLNTALSKCYIADEGGSGIGMKRGSIYIDEEIILELESGIDSKIDKEGFLFLIGTPVFETRKYIETSKLFELSRKWDSDIINDKAMWIKFGDTVQIKKGNLNFKLREIEAFSPIDEISLFWYDTFRGNMHGFWPQAIRSIDDDGSYLYIEKVINPDDDMPQILSEFINKKSKNFIK